VNQRAKEENRALRAYLEEVPFVIGEKTFYFSLQPRTFIVALQTYGGDIDKACRAAGTTLEWAKKFFSTRKFREFRNAKLRALAQRSGNLVEWWWEMGLSGARGYIEWYEGSCEICHEVNKFTTTEADSFKDDNMQIKATCKVCLQPIQAVEHKKEEFKPSREQVQFWSEIGNRVSPKIERISHEFSSENFVFQTEDQSG
jgi:hypothetical protein